MKCLGNTADNFWLTNTHLCKNEVQVRKQLTRVVDTCQPLVGLHSDNDTDPKHNKHVNSVHIWISLATVCSCLLRVSGCALLIPC